MKHIVRRPRVNLCGCSNSHKADFHSLISVHDTAELGCCQGSGWLDDESRNWFTGEQKKNERKKKKPLIPWYKVSYQTNEEKTEDKR